MSSEKTVVIDNEFEETLVETFGKNGLLAIQKTVIGIAGAGGLGSNVCINLVRSGFRNFVIADKDVIDFSNLNRQQYFYDQVGLSKVEALTTNLLRINPNISITPFIGEVTKENVNSIFVECDILIEAFDKTSSKALFVDGFLTSGKLIVAVSGLAGWGNSDDIHIRKYASNLYIIGDFKSEVNENTPAVSPRVCIAAAKEADTVLNYVLSL